MKKIVFLLSMVMFTGSTFSSELPTYKNPNASVAERVEDLLSRMSLEEKVGQMNQFVGLEHIRKNEAALSAEDLHNNTAQAFYPGFTVDSIASWTRRGWVGSFLHVQTLKEANELQAMALEAPLQIPLLFGIDAIHGNANCPDNTVYPTNIGLASSFNLDMAYRIARQTAAEMRAMNMHWTYNPNVEVARDPRWGRVGETYGEDPYLVGLMGAQTVRGYQGELGNNDVLACIKHLVGGSQPINGTNGSPTDLSERTIREVFFPPFKQGVEAGAMSLMTAHNELNGIPCHSNEWLMTDVLRGEWGFEGFVVSDWMDIEHIWDLHATAEDLKEAFYQSIMAGMDMHMHGVYWNEYVCELVREGRIAEARIDESVRKILALKFRLGLFEQPFADPEKTFSVRLCAEHRATALEAARQAIVLVKNDGLLPLARGSYKKILVTGINADDHNILGDWAAAQADENVITVLEGLREADPSCEFVFVNQDWDPQNMKPSAVAEAAEKAKECDLNIVVAGEYMFRDRWTERTSGEDTDRSDIDLVGLQNELIQKVAASGKPTILILISGRPLGVQWADEHLPAIINAWEPGMYGGQAIAEIIYGDVNPSAKLAVTIPRSIGQVQMIYNHKPSQYFHPYAVTESTPLYHFGYGLSYTTYEYSNLKCEGLEAPCHPVSLSPCYPLTSLPSHPIKVSVKVTNSGSRAGDEIVQLYIRDRFSSVTRPVKELKDFARIHLEAGESKVVEFEITADKLTFLDKNLNPVVEPGEFIVMVGPSSRDEDLLKASFWLVEPKASIAEQLTSAVSQGKIMYGHQDDWCYGHSWNGESQWGRSDVMEVCGKRPAVAGFDLGGLEIDKPCNLDKVPFELIRRAAVAQYEAGGIVTFSWHPRNPVTGGDSWDVSVSTVVSYLLNEPEGQAKFESWLSKCADFIESIRTKEGIAVPVIFRPWHEQTGSWFWWGENFCDTEEFVALWRKTYDYLVNVRGLSHLVWAYSPGAGSDAEGYMKKYPGDDVVDILGLDIYQYGTNKEFASLLSSSLKFMTKLAQEHGKFIAVTETGYESIPYPKWWSEVLLKAIEKYPVTYVLTWRNAWNRPEHYYAPWPESPDSQDFKEFYNSPRTKFLGE